MLDSIYHMAGGRMLDSIYHMALKLLRNRVKTLRFCQNERNVVMDGIT